MHCNMVHGAQCHSLNAGMMHKVDWVLERGRVGLVFPVRSPKTRRFSAVDFDKVPYADMIQMSS